MSCRLRIRIAALEHMSQRGPSCACSEFIEDIFATSTMTWNCVKITRKPLFGLLQGISPTHQPHSLHNKIQFDWMYHVAY